MINFSVQPDKIFNAILTDALDEIIGILEEDLAFNSNLSDSFFDSDIIEAYGGGKDSLKLILNVCNKLLAAHLDPINTYLITDRHFQLLDQIICNFCQLYPDNINGEYQTEEGFIIVELDSDELIDFYFWDTTYNLDPDDAKEMYRDLINDANECDEDEYDNDMCISKVSLRAAMFQLVDASDLIIKKIKPSWDNNFKYNWINGNEEVYDA